MDVPGISTFSNYQQRLFFWALLEASAPVCLGNLGSPWRRQWRRTAICFGILLKAEAGVYSDVIWKQWCIFNRYFLCIFLGEYMKLSGLLSTQWIQAIVPPDVWLLLAGVLGFAEPRWQERMAASGVAVEFVIPHWKGSRLISFIEPLMIPQFCIAAIRWAQDPKAFLAADLQWALALRRPLPGHDWRCSQCWKTCRDLFSKVTLKGYFLISGFFPTLHDFMASKVFFAHFIVVRGSQISFRVWKEHFLKRHFLCPETEDETFHWNHWNAFAFTIWMLFDLNDLMPQKNVTYRVPRNCTEAALVTNPLCQEVADSAPSSFSQTSTLWL